MTGELLTAVATAGAAVFGSILSVLLLSFRVGRLVGMVTGFMESSVTDRQALHTEIGAVAGQLDRHIESHAGRRVR